MVNHHLSIERGHARICSQHAFLLHVQFAAQPTLDVILLLFDMVGPGNIMKYPYDSGIKITFIFWGYPLVNLQKTMENHHFDG